MVVDEVQAEVVEAVGGAAEVVGAVVVADGDVTLEAAVDNLLGLQDMEQKVVTNVRGLR